MTSSVWVGQMCLYTNGTARHVTVRQAKPHHGRSCFDVGTASHDYITGVWRRRKEQSIAPVCKNEILIAPPVISLFSMAFPARSNVRRRTFHRFHRSCVDAAKKIGGTRASEILRYVQSGSRGETPLSTDIFAPIALMFREPCVSWTFLSCRCVV